VGKEVERQLRGETINTGERRKIKIILIIYFK
jgi:hypothetical protein